jgi:hypothetical protein
VNTNRSYLNNGELSFDLDTIVRKPFTVKLSGHIDHEEWNGLLTRTTKDTIDTVCSPKGGETSVSLNPSLIKQAGRITAEIDLLTD